MADVVEINEPDQLEHYRVAWNALLPRTPRASFFHSLDWLQTYWKHFGRRQRLRVLIIHSLGTPIGIVPLCINRERYHVGNVRVLTYPLSDWGMWYGPIGANQSASIFMALKHLRETPRDWDMIDLRWSAAEPGEGNTTGRALRSLGWQPHKSAYQTCSIIELSGADYDAYLAKQSKKWRHEMRRQARVLTREGEVTFERHRPAGIAHGDGQPRWDLYEDCVDVSRRSWQSESTTGNTLCHEHVCDFLRDCHAVAAKLGMLDVAVLKLDDTPTAFQYNYHFDGRVFGLRMGYAREYSKVGAGKILLSRLIEDSFQRDDQVLDLGIGDFDFKRRFRTNVETSYRFACFPWTAWKSQGVRLSRWLKHRRGRKEQAAAKTNSA